MRAWLEVLAGIAGAVGEAKGVALPEAFAGTQPTDAHKQIAKSLTTGERRVVLLGNEAVRHPDFAAIHAAAQWIAEATGATLGFLTEAANTVGAHLVNALPGEGGLNAREVFEQPRKGYLLLNLEPEFDTANPAQALAALKQAEMVVVMSPFQAGADYADVLLPIAPFTETGGAFVNAEGTVQAFNGVVRPLGDTRPAWKVLRVLGSLLGASGFEYDTVEEVRAAALGDGELSSRLSNRTGVAVTRGQAAKAAEGKFERLANVPIYHGFCHARLLYLQSARRGRRDRADDLARFRVGCDVPVHRRTVRPHALASDRRLRRRRQRDAEVRGVRHDDHVVRVLRDRRDSRHGTHADWHRAAHP